MIFRFMAFLAICSGCAEIGRQATNDEMVVIGDVIDTWSEHGFHYHIGCDDWWDDVRILVVPNGQVSEECSSIYPASMVQGCSQHISKNGYFLMVFEESVYTPEKYRDSVSHEVLHALSWCTATEGNLTHSNTDVWEVGGENSVELSVKKMWD